MKTQEFCMNMNKLCMNTHKFAWTRMKVDQNFRVGSRYLGHVTSVWKRHPNFCGSVWRPYYSTQNMWSSFTSIIITYTVGIYLYAWAPSLKKCNFCYEQIYLSLAGKGLIEWSHSHSIYTQWLPHYLDLIWSRSHCNSNFKLKRVLIRRNNSK